MHAVSIRICLDKNRAYALVKALKAELGQPQPEKGVVGVGLDGEGCLLLTIESVSVSGLRALTNSFLYLIYAALDSLERSTG